MYHSLLSDKENCFVCLFTMAFSSGKRWASFLITIPHGMHLTILTHLSLSWVVCHPKRIFPPKELEREPQNKLPLLPTVRPYPHLPLTYDPPLLYWLGTDWWCLSLMHASLPCVSMACLLLMHLSWFEGLSVHSAAHSWPLVAWMFPWAFVLYVLLPS